MSTNAGSIPSVFKSSRLLVIASCLSVLISLACESTKTHSATTKPTSQPTAMRAPRSFDTTEPVRARPIDQAIREGIAFLVRDQNDDGSWGTGLQTRGTELYSSVPGSHDAFRIGTTALCVMALREIGTEPAAHAKGVAYLIAHGDARRDTGDLLYNTWANLYALDALALELKDDPNNPSLRAAAIAQEKRLELYETYVGGWNYYDFDEQTAQPSMAATSFQTAAGLVALRDARAVGIEVPQGLIDRAVRRVEECRMPDGSYLYGADYRYIPRLPANRMNGSIGRQQSNNFALWISGSKRVGKSQCVEGLKTFFANHAWIEMGRKRPFPHEAWYQTSGYYYYFAHYYAARIIEQLDGEAQRQAALELQKFVLPFQESDGSWWDYAMWDYHKPYGTAFAVMTLLRCEPQTSRVADKPQATTIRSQVTARATAGSPRAATRPR